MAKQRFRRLGLFYLSALGGIALTIVLSQVLIQTSINSQQEDSHVINVAGRQRMLSQKISKVSIKILNRQDSNLRNTEELSEALQLWKKSHLGLQYGDIEMGLSGRNSSVIRQMFEAIEPHYQAVYANAATLLLEPSDSVSERAVSEILKHESSFLTGMDRIVFQYDNEAQAKISGLRHTEFYLFLFSLLIITLELVFIFRPLAKNVKATVEELTASEKASQKMTRELSKLYDELGKSYQDLEAVNIQPESPSLYLTLQSDGIITNKSSKFLQMMEYEEEVPPKNIKDLLQKSGYQERFITSLFDILSKRKNWNGELRLITEPGDFSWLETYLIPIQNTNEIKLIARNITEFKEAKLRSRELNKERIEKSVKEQQYRSALILQGQEEERKRLSREIHDGVGQMLSAMNLLLESFTPSSVPQKMRLEDTRSLMKSIIQEVRRVSFNLTPTSLDDFGLIAAINKFCAEIDAVTKAKVVFINETNFINRLESNIETNLYRIVQESVNNSLKYAKANHITIRFAHSINSLNITIEDDGKGFDLDRVASTGHFEKAGHGIFNMRERTAYIGGTFNLDSGLGKGTTISITLSLDKND